MNRRQWTGCAVPGVAVLFAVLMAACATPEIAKDHREPVLLPEDIMTALGSEDPTRRASAADQIEKLPAHRRVPVLEELTHDERPHVRLLVIGLLGKLHAGDATIQARLVDILAFDPDIDVRSSAVDALSRGGTPRCLDALVEALSGDTALVVRQAAAESLDRITGQTLAPPVTDAVDGALEKADEAGMAYEEWVEEHRAGLRWDGSSGRFVPAAAGGGR